MENILHKEIAKYNKALRKWVVSEYKKLNDDSAKIYMLDTNYLVIVPMAIDKKNNLVYKKSERVEKYDLFINYYWIEYDFIEGKPRKKITFYCKDIDCKTGNVHVIPEVMQEWENIEYYKYDYPNIPSLEHKDKKLFMKNVPNSAEYKSFVEEGWIPTHCGKDTLREMLDYNRVMPNFLKIQAEFSQGLNKVRKLITKRLKDKNISIHAANGRAPKYTIIKWVSAKTNGKEYIVAPYDISYVSRFGVITNYGLLSVLEYRIKERDGNRISLEYEIAPEIGSVKCNTYYVNDLSKLLGIQERFDDTVEYIKQSIS